MELVKLNYLLVIFFGLIFEELKKEVEIVIFVGNGFLEGVYLLV